MPQAARTTDPISLHSPCAPGQCGPGSDNVIIQGLSAYRVGHETLPHGIPQGTPQTCVLHTSKLVKGSTNVQINNNPAGRVGDTHICGVAIVSGSDKVIINGSGGSVSPGWGDSRRSSSASASGQSTSTTSAIMSTGSNSPPSDLTSFIKSKEGNSSTECISEAEATSRLDADVTRRKTYVNSYGQRNGYDWDENQIKALTSFAYNLGTGSIAQVTANGTRTDEVIVEKIKLYNKADGQVVAGLTQRRNEESAWFNLGV